MLPAQEKQPFPLVSVGSTCWACVSGWSKWFQAISTQLPTPAFLIYWDRACIEFQTWTVNNCQVLLYASWRQHVTRLIPFCTETAWTSNLRQLERSYVPLYKRVFHQKSQHFPSRVVFSCKCCLYFLSFTSFKAGHKCSSQLPQISQNVSLLWYHTLHTTFPSLMECCRSSTKQVECNSIRSYALCLPRDLQTLLPSATSESTLKCQKIKTSFSGVRAPVSRIAVFPRHEPHLSLKTSRETITLHELNR